MQALNELDDAYCEYEAMTPGLGDRLRAEVAAKIQMLSEFPEAYPEWEGPARRTTLRRFPYSVYYRVYPDEVRIIAVLYARIDPDFAARRVFG
jgi:plasmid stabilization system protein ParE